ncbi:MAG: hypothetical protein J6S40_01350, partial [Thermoguttaceae bacterium]|nr:hypothetical protein [Thermoguttaceae bacterium]
TYGNYLAPVGENLPGEIIAPETPSMVVTTDSDAVDPWDNLISLREALTVYYKTDGTMSYSNGNITYGKGSNTTVRFDSELTEIKPEYSYTLTGEHEGLVIEGAGHIIFNGQTCLDTDSHNFTIFNVTESASMTFNGLTFKNISTNQGAAVATASGLTLTDGDVLTLNNCVFDDNTGTANGGALSVYNLDVAISSGSFSRNSASYGGAVYVNGGSLTVDGTSTFASNNATTGNGGAVYASSTVASEDVTITGASFTGNTSSSNGGAVYLNTASDSVITDSTFTGNTVTGSNADGTTGNGGAIDSDGGNLTIDGGSFSGNTASENGGAVYVSQDLLTVENVTFTSNSSVKDGGAIYGDDNAVLHLTDATFTLNSASSDGGAVRGVGTVDESMFDRNTAANGEGGAIYSEGSKKNASSGSSVPAPTGNDTPVVKSLRVSNSTFISNSAENGGAINTDSVNLTVISSSFTTNSTSESGGAIQLHKGSATVRHSNFTQNTAKNANNHAAHGGAIYNSESSLTVVGSTFTKNESYYGGAISGQVNAEASIFTENKAVTVTDQDVTTGNGGAIYGNGTFRSCTFTSNTANNGGAYFCLVVDTQDYIDDCTFTANGATVYGGAVCGVKVHATNSSFSQNTAGTKVGNRYTGGYGGAVAAEDVTADFQFENCSFTGNAATHGGAVHGDNVHTIATTFQENRADYGGAVNTDSTTAVFSFEGGAFFSNSATMNGGAVLGVEVSASGVRFRENTAGWSGGALFASNASSVFTISDSKFYANTADHGGAILAKTLSVTSSLFENNRATSGDGSGGAIVASKRGSGEQAANFTILESIFTGNSAKLGGAVCGETVTVTRSTFEENTASTGGAICDRSDIEDGNVTVAESHFNRNTALSGDGYGGAIYTNTLTVSDNSVFNANQAKDGGAVHVSGG